jgi:hypothetical protein
MEPERLLLGEMLEVPDPLETVHVVSVDVGHEHVVDSEEIERARQRRLHAVPRLTKDTPVRVRAVDRQAEAVVLEEQRVGDVPLAEGVADAEDEKAQRLRPS